MKKLIIMVVALALLVVGFGMADPGINETPENQYVTITTKLDVDGAMTASAKVDYRIDSLDDVRNPIMDALGDRHYTSLYKDDTVVNQYGTLQYTKSLGVDTRTQLTGGSNILASKDIDFVGDAASDITSDEYINVDGVFAGTANINTWALCMMAAADTTQGFPAGCNFAEAQSKTRLTYAKVHTDTSDRFVVVRSDANVDLRHTILVEETASGPSYGDVEADMYVLIQESRNPGDITKVPPRATMHEKIEITDKTRVDDSDIYNFEKDMHYRSGIPLRATT